MSTAQGSLLAHLSPSVLAALQWAQGAAAHRTANVADPTVVVVGSDDLLVGILLAHPQEDGETRVLLGHFGLTARDVLPESYPKLSAADLRHRAAELNPSADPPLGTDTAAVLDAARRLGGSDATLRHVLGALLQQTQPLRWSEAFASRGTEQTQVMDSYQRWLTVSHPDNGGSLADWLATESPRRPLDLPVYAADRIDAEQDLIGIQTEADAFAYLIASRDLRPPLAIGLFGDWGSGKSFLMRAVDQRLRNIKRLVADTDQHSVRVWKNIVTIEFNAWEYVQGNLWAGLLERIFGQLGSLQPRLVESWRQPAQDQLAEVEKAAEELDVLRRQAAEQQDKLRREADDAQREAEEERAKADSEASVKREALAQDRARQALRVLWGRLPVALLGRGGTDFVEALGEARAELARGHALLGAYWRRPKHVFLVSVAALLVPVVALLLVWAKVPLAVSVLGGLATVVPVLTATLGTATRWGRQQLTYLENQLADLDKAGEKVRDRIYQPVREAEARADEARAALEAAQRELSATERQLGQAEERRQQLEAELADLTPGRILVDFADQRSTEYGRRLGLLAQVRRDLAELEHQIAVNNALLATAPPARPAGPAGRSASPMYDVPNRIVLYIDDLDRCPPAKVLEVLEAVHLLLSFEMFVVVVAVDSRWLTSALTDRLVALRSPQADAGQPTPKDYLEKIFQLPFWVQPLPPAGREQLLRGLLIDSVRDQGGSAGPDDKPPVEGVQVGDDEVEVIEAMLLRHGTEVRLDTSPLVLSLGDLTFFESLAPLLGDTPRRIKRFVNTCQLLFAMAPALPPGDYFPSERAIVSLVGAISEGLPNMASLLFAALEAPGQQTLADFLNSCQAAAPDERDRLAAWLAAHSEWQQVQLPRLAVRLDMIRRLRFDKPALAATVKPA